MYCNITYSISTFTFDFTSPSNYLCLSTSLSFFASFSIPLCSCPYYDITNSISTYFNFLMCLSLFLSVFEYLEAVDGSGLDECFFVLQRCSQRAIATNNIHAACAALHLISDMIASGNRIYCHPYPWFSMSLCAFKCIQMCLYFLHDTIFLSSFSFLFVILTNTIPY